MLEFCIDLTLYFLRVPESFAAIHCKAGKGRTGTMIICYLIFSGLFDNIDMAIYHYGSYRTLNEKVIVYLKLLFFIKGVTIESQKRYIRYFQNLLITKFSKPYINCIPEMIKFCLSEDQDKLILTKSLGLTDNDQFIILKNIITNLLYDKTYFYSKNYFEINYLQFDNMSNRDLINFKIESLFQKNLKYGKIKYEYVIYDEDNMKSNNPSHDKSVSLNQNNNNNYPTNVEGSNSFDNMTDDHQSEEMGPENMRDSAATVLSKNRLLEITKQKDSTEKIGFLGCLKKLFSKLEFKSNDKYNLRIVIFVFFTYFF